MLDRHDGSFLVFYRAYESVDELLINVKYNGKDVAESPYILKGMLLHGTDGSTRYISSSTA